MICIFETPFLPLIAISPQKIKLINKKTKKKNLEILSQMPKLLKDNNEGDLYQIESNKRINFQRISSSQKFIVFGNHIRKKNIANIGLQ